MSLPRRIVPGRQHMLTRRCAQRQLLLRPSERVNQIVEFCLAVAAERTNVLLHVYNFLSNHYHLVVTDVEGRLPEFMRWANGYIAKCMNLELGRGENFWSAGSYNSVELLDQAATLSRMVYVYANPVSSGLVRSSDEWPGAHSTPADLEREGRVVQRPSGFFRDVGTVPESVLLRVTAPLNLKMSVDELECIVAEREQKLREEAMQRHRSFLGRNRVLRQSPYRRPQSSEARRTPTPRVAARDPKLRLQALSELKAFWNSYRDAFTNFVAGIVDTVFPFGTYGMRVNFGVRCHGP